MIRQFKLNRGFEVYKDYVIDDEELIHLTPLSKINFFVGINNSGKSRFLRELVKDLTNYKIYDPDDKTPPLHFHISKNPKLSLVSIDKEKFLEAIFHHYEQIESQSKKPSFLVPLFDLLQIEEKTLSEKDLVNFYIDFQAALKKFLDAEFYDSQADLRNNSSKESVRRQTIINHIQSALSIIKDNLSLDLKNRKVTYIPTYRTIRRFLTKKENKLNNYWGRMNYKMDDFEPIKDPIFESRILIDYFSEKKYESEHSTEKYSYDTMISDTNIFTGEKLYDIIYDLRNSPEDKRNILTDFENFLSKNFFNSLKVSLNSLANKDIKDIHVKIGDNKEFPIFNLGDGIQSIIILTFPLFYYKEYKHFIFYEEPELNLHPGMQRILIETIKSFKNAQTFIATHSNHFLDTTLDFPDDISIFSIKKGDNVLSNRAFYIENLSSPSISILNLLGVRNSSVFLSNCSIWVEGISDRIYIRKFLDLYQEQNPDTLPNFPIFKEDFHYTFVEFNGNNITHFNFSENGLNTNSSKINAKKISNRIFLIHDQDTDKEKRHELLKEQLGDNYYKLKVLEIENLLSPDVLKKTLFDYKYQNVKTVTFPNFTHKEYKMKPIGEYIFEIADSTKTKKIVSQGTDSTTRKIYNKLDFSQKAVAHIKSWNDLTDECQAMTKSIYNFIKNNNNCNF